MTQQVDQHCDDVADHGVDIVDQRRMDQTQCPPELLHRTAAILRAALTAEGVSADAEVSLTLVDADEMAELNTAYMNADHTPTDVLSFPIDGAAPGDDGSWLVGDVVLCPQVAAAQAPTHTGDFADELGLLAIHSALHLCGWDHFEKADRDAMWDRERELADQLLPSMTSDPWARRDGEEFTGQAD